MKRLHLLLLATTTSLIATSWAAQLPPLVSMTRPEEALATHFTKFGHGSTFVELEGGRILHAGGTSFTTSDDRGLTWSKATQFKDLKGNPVGGAAPCLVRLSGKGVGLAAIKFDAKAATPEEKAWSYHIEFWRSEDGGQTWQEPVRASPLGMQTHCLQDVALRTASGRIVVPVYAVFGQRVGPDNNEIPAVGRLVNNQWLSTNAHFHDPRFMGVYLIFSDNDGRTWKRNRDGLMFILHDWSTNYDKVNEPSVTEVSPGRLLMVMRSSLNRLYQAWSSDNGDTWTRPSPMSLAANETPAQIRKLPNGHLLIVWNQESDGEVMRGQNRTRVSAAISRNGGSVWEFFQNITSLLPGTRVEPGPIRAVRPTQVHFGPGQPAPVRDTGSLGDSDSWIRTSYPSVFVLPDRVLVAHTYGRMQEDPVKAQMVSGESYNQVLRVLPLKWFYGGKEPAANPQLKQALEPAKP